MAHAKSANGSPEQPVEGGCSATTGALSNGLFTPCECVTRLVNADDAEAATAVLAVGTLALACGRTEMCCQGAGREQAEVRCVSEWALGLRNRYIRHRQRRVVETYGTHTHAYAHTNTRTLAPIRDAHQPNKCTRTHTDGRASTQRAQAEAECEQ